MKALLIITLFVTTHSYSQSLGWTYSNSLLAVKNNIGIKFDSFEEKTNDYGVKYISAHLMNNDCTAEVYYFSNETNLCIEVRLMYKISHINKFIEEMNTNYTILSELKWKDYSKDVLYEVIKNDTYFALRIYK